MLRLICVFSYVVLYLLGSVPVSGRLKKIYKSGNINEYDKQVNAVVSRFGRKVLKKAGADVTVIGAENLPETAAVFVANHQSDFDSLVILGYFEKVKAFFAKSEMLKVPLISSWMKHMRCVFVVRKNHAASTKAIRAAEAQLREGYSMVIFPEGTRSKTGHAGTFKYGAFKIADAAGVPIVPVKITGTRRMFEQNKFGIKKGPIQAIILPPVDIRAMSPEQKAHAHEIVRDMIENAAGD